MAISDRRFGDQVMSLAGRTHLGPYEFTGRLGTGGMGEVYRARDTRLGREVAIKLLPPEVSAEPRVSPKGPTVPLADWLVNRVRRIWRIELLRRLWRSEFSARRGRVEAVVLHPGRPVPLRERADQFLTERRIADRRSPPVVARECRFDEVTFSPP